MAETLLWVDQIKGGVSGRVLTDDGTRGVWATSLPASIIGSGQLLAARGGTGADLSASTAGRIPYFTSTGVMGSLAVGTNGHVLTLAAGVPTWAAAASAGVTSVAMTVPSILSVAGSPITSTGTLAVTLANQNANLVFAGPGSGGATTPTFRSLVALDIPNLPTSILTTGQLGSARGGTGADLSAAAQGAVPFFSATGVMSGLAAGTSGYVLTAQGVAANPIWAAIGSTAISGATNQTVRFSATNVLSATSVLQIDSSGNAAFGTLTPDRPLSVNSANNPLAAGEASMMIIGAVNKERVEIRSAGASGGVPVFQGASMRGSISSPTALQDGDILAAFNGRGYDGSALASASTGVSMNAEGNWTVSARGGQIRFLTTPSGGTTRAERLYITGAGNIVPGTAALATTSTDGFTYMQTCAGAPTGVPTAYTGRSPYLIDTVNGVLYAYFGGAWHGLIFDF